MHAESIHIRFAVLFYGLDQVVAAPASGRAPADAHDKCLGVALLHCQVTSLEQTDVFSGADVTSSCKGSVWTPTQARSGKRSRFESVSEACSADTNAAASHRKSPAPVQVTYLTLPVMVRLGFRLCRSWGARVYLSYAVPRFTMVMNFSSTRPIPAGIVFIMRCLVSRLTR